MKKPETNIEGLIVRFLDGSITSSEKRELSRLIESSEANAKEFVRLCKTWELSEAGLHDYNDREAYARLCEMTGVKNAGRVRPLRRRLYLAAGIAAGIVVAVASTLYFTRSGAPYETDIVSFVNSSSRPDIDGTETRLVLSDDNTVLLDDKESSIEYAQANIKVNDRDVISKKKTARFNQLIIPYGKKSTITFSDGTKAWANAGTRIVYPVEFNGGTREIYVDGEIYIDVVPDKDHPFTVRTNDLNITVLGTRFNVRAYESDNIKDITLVSGSVKVVAGSGEDEGTVLSPDQQYVYNHSEGTNRIKPVDASEHIMWIKGLYIFKNESLQAMIEYLSKYHGVKIGCDPQIAGLLYSGKMDLNNALPVILKHITRSLPIEFEELDGGEYFLRMKK